MEKSLINFILSTDKGMHEEIKQEKEYERLADESIEIYNKLMATLNDEQKKYFNTFAETQLGLECKSSDTYFKEGLIFGIRLLIECLLD